jgi:hypothetical protein
MPEIQQKDVLLVKKSHAQSVNQQGVHADPLVITNGI